MGKRKPNVVEANPKMLLNLAREFFSAAEAVYEKGVGLWEPLNFLYFHTVELLLKSFLRAAGRKPNATHEILDFLREARSLGLIIPGDKHGLESIVGLLTAGNVEHAFRYGTSKSTSLPHVTWTREVVGKLVEVVSASVDPNNELKTPGPAVTFRMVIGPPVRGSK
jgi:HEPN domain